MRPFLPCLLATLVACDPNAPSKPRSDRDDTDSGLAQTDTGSSPDTAADTGTPDTGWDPSLDSDGDTVSDTEEGRAPAPGTSLDTDGDLTPDYLDSDNDDDGVSDAREARSEGASALLDTDADGTPDLRDRDSDNDGLADAMEAAPLDGAGDLPDTDADGTPDLRDSDTDADGLADALEAAEDWDADGVPNFRDPRNDGALAPIRFFAISTPFNGPIGIDFHEPSATVVMSVNYDRGGLPQVLERVNADGTHTPFSALAGLTDEVKIATARAGNPGGFEAGSLYVGNGVDGQIVRVSADGSTIDNPWVDLPGTGNGLMRGSLHVDPTGAWGGDLIVVTTEGELWRINRDGAPTLIADVNVHLEGLFIVPDAPARYGPLAGKALAGAENEGLIYVFSPDGTYTTLSLGVRVEDIDLANPYENFFGVNHGTSRVIGAYARDFQGMWGDLLLTQEGGTTLQLYRLRWDGAALSVEALQAAGDSPAFGSWEHVTFARAGIKEVGIGGR